MLPTTDIVIIDRYLFTNACELVEYNINRILSALSYNVKNKINVVLFTKKDSLILFGVDNATKIIKKTLENVTGMKPQITFVSSNDGKLIPHDCFAITNYRLMRSGDSFLYFDTSGKPIINGGTLDVDSLAKH